MQHSDKEADYTLYTFMAIAFVVAIVAIAFVVAILYFH